MLRSGVSVVVYYVYNTANLQQNILQFSGRIWSYAYVTDIKIFFICKCGEILIVSFKVLKEIFT